MARQESSRRSQSGGTRRTSRSSRCSLHDVYNRESGNRTVNTVFLACALAVTIVVVFGDLVFSLLERVPESELGKSRSLCEFGKLVTSKILSVSPVAPLLLLFVASLGTTCALCLKPTRFSPLIPCLAFATSVALLSSQAACGPNCLCTSTLIFLIALLFAASVRWISGVDASLRNVVRDSQFNPIVFCVLFAVILSAANVIAMSWNIGAASLAQSQQLLLFGAMSVVIWLFTEFL